MPGGTPSACGATARHHPAMCCLTQRPMRSPLQLCRQMVRSVSQAAQPDQQHAPRCNSDANMILPQYSRPHNDQLAPDGFVWDTMPVSFWEVFRQTADSRLALLILNLKLLSWSCRQWGRPNRSAGRAVWAGRRRGARPSSCRCQRAA